MPTKFVTGTFALALTGAFVLVGAARADQATAPNPRADMCLAVAQAKFQQWTQPRLMIEQTNTYADGSQRGRELIVTPNTAYARYGDHWKTANVTRPERGAGSPEMLAKHMGLATCAKGEHVQEAGIPATVYTFSYKPDDNGSVSKGSISIADASGLPLRQEFDQNGPLANSRVAKTIETTYSYNDDVTIPGSAELAENERLFGNPAPFAAEQFNYGAGSTH